MQVVCFLFVFVALCHIQAYENLDGLIIVLCGHGTMGEYVASDDPGPHVMEKNKQRRVSLDDIREHWSAKQCKTLASYPKIILKVACRGFNLAETLKIRLPHRGPVMRGGASVKWVHPLAEFVTIYASMPKSTIFDGGAGRGSYLVNALDEILRNDEYRFEDLDSMVLRLRRGVGKMSSAKEWVQVEHSHSKKIFLFRKEADG